MDYLRNRLQIHFYYFFYRSLNLALATIFNEFDTYFDSTTKLMTKLPKDDIIVAEEFNIHNSDWVRHSIKKSEILFKESLLTQILHELNTFFSLHILKTILFIPLGYFCFVFTAISASEKAIANVVP